MSEALTTYRAEHGLTLKDLAQSFGVNAPAVCKWEHRRIPAERVLDVARITGIPKEKLRPDLYREDAA